MIATTTISSMRVKPDSGRLPVRILRSIQRDARASRADVEHVRVVPGVRLPVLQVGPYHPIGLARHGIEGDPPEELELPLFQLAGVQPLDERVEIGRITLRSRLLEGLELRRLADEPAIVVDRGPDRAKVAPQLQLLL